MSRSEQRFVPDLTNDPIRLSAKHSPKLRGVLHGICAPISLVASIALVAVAPADHTLAFALFGASVTLMLTVSAIYHLKSWTDTEWWQMRKLDMTAIYLLIAGSYTGITTGLEDPARVRVLLAVWIGALAGIAVRWLPIKPPFGLTNTIFLVVGATFLVVLPALRETLGQTGFVLLIGGCLLYLVGALLLGARWPNLAPGWFGYHELWHLLVVIALIMHFVLMFTVVRDVAV